MAKWMRDLVIGKNTGESVEGVSVPDDDASQEDKENLKPKKVRLTIKAIDTATLPDSTTPLPKKSEQKPSKRCALTSPSC